MCRVWTWNIFQTICAVLLYRNISTEMNASYLIASTMRCPSYRSPFVQQVIYQFILLDSPDSRVYRTSASAAHFHCNILKIRWTTWAFIAIDKIDRIDRIDSTVSICLNNNNNLYLIVIQLTFLILTFLLTFVCCANCILV